MYGDMMKNLIKKAAKDIAAAKRITALTGAGISVESGIPPFRGKNGLWEKIDPMKYAHIDYFLQNPADVWNKFLKEMRSVISQAQPNDAHRGLAKLEEMNLLQTVITQNIDGLHQMAGNTDVIEFHGNFAWLRCLECNAVCQIGDADLSEIPPKCSCGGLYRPDSVFFGEMIPPLHLKRSHEIASACDLMLVVGTSALVQPAALMPVIARNSGAKIIEINPEATPLTGSTSNYLLMGTAGEIMNNIITELEGIAA